MERKELLEHGRAHEQTPRPGGNESRNSEPNGMMQNVTAVSPTVCTCRKRGGCGPSGLADGRGAASVTRHDVGDRNFSQSLFKDH